MKKHSVYETWLLRLSYLLFEIFIPGTIVDASTPKCGEVFLTVSSDDEHLLELNWQGCSDIQLVKLQNHKPFENPANHITYELVWEPDQIDGFHRTKVQFNDSDWPDKWRYNVGITERYMGSINFPFWIVSMSKSGIQIDYQALKMEPTWMYDNRAALAHIRLGELAIPGTHDSGCYKGSGLYHNFIYSQDYSIWEQLVLGIRSLDLRVVYYDSDDTFYINHDFIYIRKLKDVYEQIYQFLVRSVNEIVILDLHSFPHPKVWTDKLHRRLILMTKDYFGDFTIPNDNSQKGPKLGDIWRTTGRVILAYEESKFVSDYSFLWPPVQEAWANTIEQHNLKTFFEKFLNEGSSRPFHSLMAELTPRVVDVIFEMNNLRKLANKTNKELTKWVRDEWSDKVNIVATDYFLGNNIIQVAININKNKRPSRK